jgi:hypothetical protein
VAYARLIVPTFQACDAVAQKNRRERDTIIALCFDGQLNCIVLKAHDTAAFTHKMVLNGVALWAFRMSASRNIEAGTVLPP